MLLTIIEYYINIILFYFFANISMLRLKIVHFVRPKTKFNLNHTSLFVILPALMTSTPVGYHLSPCRSSSSTVLGGSVRQYSPSSTCVPSLSNTKRTGSLAATDSFSFPGNNYFSI